MKSSSFKMSVLTGLKLLGTTFWLAGCTLTPTTQTAAIELDAEITQSVCGVWKVVTYSSRDTEQTQLEVRANNAARGAYCG